MYCATQQKALSPPHDHRSWQQRHRVRSDYTFSGRSSRIEIRLITWLSPLQCVHHIARAPDVKSQICLSVTSGVFVRLDIVYMRRTFQIGSSSHWRHRTYCGKRQMLFDPQIYSTLGPQYFVTLPPPPPPLTSILYSHPHIALLYAIRILPLPR